MYVCSFNVTTQAQIIGPTVGEVKYPAPSTAGDPVYRVMYSSSYSYFDVRFDMTATGVFQPQDLYVYSWTGDNFFKNGISWLRKDPTTESTIDSGYIALPDHYQDIEVGIVQDATDKVYVVASYVNHSLGAQATVAFYEWLPTGLNPTPTYVEDIRYVDPLYPAPYYFSPAARITMDCLGLKKIIFSWNEGKRKAIVPPSTTISVTNPGGIMLRAAKINPTAGFPLIWSNSVIIDDTDSFTLAPDVAFAADASDTLIYVAFMRIEDPAVSPFVNADIEVHRLRFDDIMTATPPYVPSIIEHVEPLATKLMLPHQNNHIRIDAPDYGNSRIWSVVYLKDYPHMNTLTKDPSSLMVNHFTNILSTAPGISNFQSPAIAYAPALDHIAIGFYNNDYMLHLGTKLDIKGINYIAPASATALYQISIDKSFQIGKISFSTSQQEAAKGLFMSYTITENVPGAIYGIARKRVRWNSMIPFSAPKSNQPILPILYPNPVSSVTQLTFNNVKNTAIEVRIVDLSGKEIFSIHHSDLYYINIQLQNIYPRIPAGSYLMMVAHNSFSSHTIPFVKQ